MHTAQLLLPRRFAEIKMFLWGDGKQNFDLFHIPEVYSKPHSNKMKPRNQFLYTLT